MANLSGLTEVRRCCEHLPASCIFIIDGIRMLRIDSAESLLHQSVCVHWLYLHSTCQSVALFINIIFDAETDIDFSRKMVRDVGMAIHICDDLACKQLSVTAGRFVTASPILSVSFSETIVTYQR